MYANPILLPQMTNRESWTLTVSVFDDDTGDPFNLVGIGTDWNGDWNSDFSVPSVAVVSIQFEVRRAGPNGQRYGSGGYGPLYDWGSYEDGPLLQASIGSGITIVAPNVFQVYFSETDMRKLHPRTYNVGCTMASLDGIDVRQLFRGRLPILDGYVTT